MLTRKILPIDMGGRRSPGPTPDDVSSPPRGVNTAAPPRGVNTAAPPRGDYAVAARDIGYVDSPTHVPFGAWRSVDHSQHGFFTEYLHARLERIRL